MCSGVEQVWTFSHWVHVLFYQQIFFFVSFLKWVRFISTNVLFESCKAVRYHAGLLRRCLRFFGSTRQSESDSFFLRFCVAEGFLKTHTLRGVRVAYESGGLNIVQSLEEICMAGIAQVLL